jgi:hypothetical protein
LHKESVVISLDFLKGLEALPGSVVLKLPGEGNMGIPAAKLRVSEPNVDRQVGVDRKPSQPSFGQNEEDKAAMAPFRSNIAMLVGALLSISLPATAFSTPTTTKNLIIDTDLFSDVE